MRIIAYNNLCGKWILNKQMEEKNNKEKILPLEDKPINGLKKSII